MTEINDDKILEITEIAYNTFKGIRTEETLNPNALKEFKEASIKPLYPRKYDENSHEMRKYFCSEACCQESSGAFLCAQREPDKSFIKDGLGVCMYFNFLKHSSVYYFIFSFLAIAVIAVCMAVAVQNGSEPLSNYTTFFFSTTYGSFSSSKNKCQYFKISTNTASVSLSCPYGKLNRVGSVFTSQSLNSLLNCRNQMKKIELNKNSTSSYVISESAVCNSQQNACDITFVFNGLQNSNLLSYAYECKDNVYSLGLIHGQSSKFLYFGVALDLAFIVFFLLFILAEKIAQKRQKNFFNMNQLSLKDFSLEVEGIHRNTAEKQVAKLIQHLSTQLQKPIDQLLFSITLPQCEQMIQNHYSQKLAFESMYNLINDFYFKNETNQTNFKQLHKIVLENKTNEDYEEFKTKIKEEINNFSEFKRRDFYKESTEELPLFLVFTTVEAKRKALETQQKDCCKLKVIIDQNQYLFKEPQLPDMIQWENRPYWTTVRIIISWILTLAICLGSYMLFGYIQFRQSQLFTDYNYGINCNVLFSSTQLSAFDSSLSSDSNYITCICKNESLLSLASDNNSYCKQWQRQYITYMAVPLIISLCIVIYNVCVSYLFKIMTKQEKQNQVVLEQMSYTFKRAFLLILNMGVIMILLNINFNQTLFNSQDINFLFTGKYDDFTADWYSNIGAVIILTMIFNIAFPIIELLLVSVVKGLKKCWDTRCCRVPTSCESKKQFISLYSEDIFPIGERYAYLIATFIVSLAFCGVIPILIPVTFISVFLLYFADKVLLFKIYQIPINYTSSLHKVLSKVLLFGVLVHLAFTAYLLSEPSLIVDSVKVNSLFSTGSQRLNSMFTIPYIIPYVILFLLIVACLVLKTFIIDFFRKCFGDKLIEFSEKFVDVEIHTLLNKRNVDLLLRVAELNMATLSLKKNQNLIQTIAAQSNTEKELFENVAVQEDILSRQIKILNSRNGDLALKGGDSVITFLGLPSYEHLIKQSNLQRLDQMIELEKKFRITKKSAVAKPAEISQPAQQSSQKLDKQKQQPLPSIETGRK